MPDHVFISYRNVPEDAAYVERLSAYLEENGVSNWFDVDIPIGDRWHLFIKDKIESCSALIVIMTPEAEASSWVMREVQEAEDLRKPIFPLLLRGRRFFRLNDLQYEDAHRALSPRGGELLQQLRVLHAKSATFSHAEVEPPATQAFLPLGRVGARLAVGDPGRAFTEVRPVFPVDATAPADTVIDGGSLQDLEIRCASIRGLDHRYNGSPRQDAFSIGVDPSREWLVMVIADGVGSARQSHLAAGLIVGRALEIVTTLLADKHPDEMNWYGVFDDLAKEILEAAQRSLGYTGSTEIVRDMSTAALIAVYEVSPPDTQRALVVAAIGDSSAYTLSRSRRWHGLPSKPFEEGTLRPPSYALPGGPKGPTDVRVNSYRIRPSDTLVIVSEGVGDPLGSGHGEVGMFLGAAWQDPPELLQFAEQAAFGRKTYVDDRTAIVVWPPDRD